MKTATKIFLLLALCVVTAIVFFMIGVGVTFNYGAKAVGAAVPTFSGVALEGDLTADGFGVIGPVLICGIKSTSGDTPEQVVLEYRDQNSYKLLGSKTVEVKTNDRGGRYIQDSIPKFDGLAVVHIKRSQ